MEQSEIISSDIITKYKLENENFKCPVCDETIISIFLNEHYMYCKFEKLKKLQNEIFIKNLKIQNENKQNYFRIMFTNIFNKLSDVTDQLIFDYKLDLYEISKFKNLCIMSEYTNKDREFDNV